MAKAKVGCKFLTIRYWENATRSFYSPIGYNDGAIVQWALLVKDGQKEAFAQDGIDGIAGFGIKFKFRRSCEDYETARMLQAHGFGSIYGGL